MRLNITSHLLMENNRWAWDWQVPQLTVHPSLRMLIKTLITDQPGGTQQIPPLIKQGVASSSVSSWSRRTVLPNGSDSQWGIRSQSGPVLLIQ